MAFKFVAFAALLAYANAGYLSAPLAYSAPVAVHAPAIGASHQSVVRSPFGNQAVSQYTKSVDTAFSSVRKFDTRITNDALLAHAPVVSTYAAAPVAVAHAAPVVAHAPVAVGYSPAAVVSHATFSGLGASYAW